MPDPPNRLKWNATVKAYPAICDLSAMSSVARVSVSHTKVGAGDYDHDFYMVPADRILVVDLIYLTCSQGDPTTVAMAIWEPPTEYYFYLSAYGGGFESHYWDKKITLVEGEELRAIWANVGNGNVLYATMLGTLHPKYD